MELKNQDLETMRWSYEENSKVVRQLMKAHTRAHESIKMFISGLCNIGILCSNNRTESSRASYHIELKNQDLETQRWSYEVNTKVMPE